MILLVNGSAAKESSNGRLLKAISQEYASYEFESALALSELPLFSPDHDIAEHHTASTLRWRKAVREASGVIICTPVYLFNIPAQLKNALEWLTTSGELYEKPVCPMTYTPHEPRGEKAMASLLQSLDALNARVIASCDLYQSTLKVTEDGMLEGQEGKDMIGEILHLLR